MTIKLEKSKIRYLFLYTISFLVTAVAVFGWLFLNGKGLCWNEDAISQYIPKAYYYIREGHEYLAGLLSGDLVPEMYDFSIGYGDMVPLHFEPIYWLYLLTDESHIEFTFSFLMVFRFYIGGLAMSVFLRYFENGEYESILGSMLYIFSGFPTVAVLWHTQFMIPMILLPLMIVAMEELLWKKKWYYFTVLVLISIWCGYYFTFMNTIGLGVFYLIRFIFTKQERSIKEFFIKGLRITGSYTLGILMGNITFFSTFAAYLNSSRTSGSKIRPDSLLHYEKGWITTVYKDFLISGTAPGHWVHLGFIGISYLAVAILLIKRGEQNLRRKVFFLIATTALLVPAAGYIMSGFSNGNNRWCYMYSLVIAMITASMIPQLLNLKKWQLGYLFLTILPYEILCGIAFLEKRKLTVYVISGIMLLAAYLLFLVLHFISDQFLLWKKAAVAVVSVGMLSILAWTLYDDSMYDLQADFLPAGTVTEKITGTPLRVADSINDDGFYRVISYDTSSVYQGSSMFLDYNGVVYFNSTINGNILDFYREMGLTTWTLVKIRGLGNRSMLSDLAGVKYLILNENSDSSVMFGYRHVQDIEEDGKVYSVYENQYALPLGITYDKVISVDELEKYNTAQRQEVLLQAAAIENDEYASVTSDSQNIEITGKKLDITKIETTNATVSEDSIKFDKKNGSVTFFFDSVAGCELYLFFENMSYDSSKSFKMHWQSGDLSGSYNYRGDNNTYSTGQNDYILDLCYNDNDRTSVTITADKKCTIKFDEVSVYMQPMKNVGLYTDHLKEEQLENINVVKNGVEGDLTVEEEKLLVLSIPYQKGWTAYIDGKKTERIKTNLMYTGIMVPKGTHHIVMKYEIPGIRISLLISMIGLLIFIGALIFTRYKCNKNH